MTTSDELRARALALAQAGASTDDAVAELLEETLRRGSWDVT